MKRIWSIAWFEIRRVFQKPASYVMMFGMPIIFTMIFGSAVGDSTSAAKTKIALIDQDQTVVSTRMIEQIKQDPMLKITEPDLDAAKVQLKDKTIMGIVILPKGLEHKLAEGEQVDLVFQHGPELGLASSIRQSIGDVMAQAIIQIKAAQLWSQNTHETAWQSKYDQLATASNDTQLIDVKTSTVTKNQNTRELNNTSGRAVGFSLMFLMFTLLSVTGTILQARQNGVWYRLLSTPSSRFETLGGYLLSFFIIGWLQFGILMFLSSVLFDIHWGNIIGQIILVSTILLCVVGLGLMIAGFVRTTEQQSALGTIVIVSTCMLGGVYWPLDVVPDFMQKLANFIPQTWAMRGFTELIARGGSIQDILGPLSVLLGFAAVFLLLGISRVRYE